MNTLEYARLVPTTQQMKEGWLLVHRDDGTQAIERYDEDPENIFADDDEARYFVAECAAQTVYLLQNRQYHHLFMSRAGSWDGLACARVFRIDEIRTANPPALERYCGGSWLALNPHFGVRYVD